MANGSASLLKFSDAEIVQRMKDTDEDGLRALLLIHGPKVRGFLERRHGFHVAAEAINESALLIFVDKINTYNPTKGPLGPWFLRIAHRKAIDIRKGEDRKKFARLEFAPADDPSECDDSEYRKEKGEDPQRRERRKQDLQQIVADLSRVPRTVTLCDMQDPTGRATLDVIRTALDNPNASVNSVDVARSKARAQIREKMRQLGHYA